MFKAMLRRIWWRVSGTPQQRREQERRDSRDHVPLFAIQNYLKRKQEPSAPRVRALHEAISRELLELTRARHTLAAQSNSSVLPMRKKEA